MKVHILIVTYNGMPWLPKTLESIARSEYLVDVIIVDNNSSDGTQQFIREEFPAFHFIGLDNNLGFGKANNLGIDIALREGTDAVFLLNQDAYIEPGTLGNLVALSTSLSHLGILSPVHLNGEGTQVDVGFQNYLKKKVHISTLGHIEKYGAIVEVPFVNAAAWFLPKQTLLTVGGFDPLFPHYGEDYDYCNRVKYHKLRVIVAEAIFICHDRRQVISSNVDKSSPKFRNGVYVNFLALVKKPGDRIALSCVKVIIYAIFNSCKEIISGNLKVATVYFSALIKILGSFRLIIQSKENTRAKQPTFLNNNYIKC